MTSRPSTAAPILAAFAILAALLGAYVAGYFWLGKRQDVFATRLGFSNLPPKLVAMNRTYAQQWLTTIFKPAGKVETWVRGVEVEIMSSTERMPGLSSLF